MPAPQPLAPSAEEEGYVTIIPDVTYSPAGQIAAQEPTPLAPEADVMASILSVPAGAASSRADCLTCDATAIRAAQH